MQADAIIILAIVAAVVLVIAQLVKLLQSMMLHRTVREALTRDNALTPELLDRLDQPRPAAGSGDDRIGLVLIALGAALIVFAYLQGSPDTIHNLAPASVFPLFVGGVLVGRYYVVRAREGGR
jgi:hypothetical protein